MSLKGIHVLHIQSFNNQGNAENPLTTFKAAINPFSPMTCARHVYVFMQTDRYDITALHSYLTEHSTKCESLTGARAYFFLLRWAVGAESHKLKSNDHFVLGAIRDTWSYYHATNPTVDVAIVKVMQLLLEDARHIRHAIQDLHIDPDAAKELLTRMSLNCVKSREADQKPAYEALLQDHQEYLETAKTAFAKKQLVDLRKSMKALNLNAKVESFKPSQIDQKLPPNRMFITNLTNVLQKQVILRDHNIKDAKPNETEVVSQHSLVLK